MKYDSLIHPILPRKDYGKIVQITGAKNATVYSGDKEIIDGIAGLWNVILGHGNQEINGAIVDQLNKVGFINPWTCSTEVVYQLAEKLIHFTEADYHKVMFTCTGSEAVELAIKLARRHQSALGKQKKKYIAVFDSSYHGTYYGSMTATGVDREYYEPYGPMLQGFAYLPIPFAEKGMTNAALQSLEKFFVTYGEQLSAFLMEPILGVAGVVKIPDVYFKRLKELCEQYGVLIIFDEISTGFYRTGPKFAFHDMEITPDLLCLSKGINNGVLPLGTVLMNKKIADKIREEDFINHLSTQNANPVCCATAVKTMEILERDQYGEIVKEKSAYFYEKLIQLQTESSFVHDIRCVGLMIGIELKMENDFSYILDFTTKLAEEGVLVYPYFNQYSTGIMLMPPYIITYHEIDKIITILKTTFAKQLVNVK
ncbi:aspartate aminotransferase family protein [Bacillus kwashiorkori]|uniref:aminotransferase family protein n=1 Tax=Bacillus kwashiorkori TaxID=1522318 RepID=UPI000785F2BE|nr:aminotransferase class III-fold pyridoxal phosphate-dependent enzyme [Bacillus kwashiorkori]